MSQFGQDGDSKPSLYLIELLQLPADLTYLILRCALVHQLLDEADQVREVVPVEV